MSLTNMKAGGQVLTPALVAIVLPLAVTPGCGSEEASPRASASTPAAPVVDQPGKNHGDSGAAYRTSSDGGRLRSEPAKNREPTGGSAETSTANGEDGSAGGEDGSAGGQAAPGGDPSKPNPGLLGVETDAEPVAPGASECEVELAGVTATVDCGQAEALEQLAQP